MAVDTAGAALAARAAQCLGRLDFLALFGVIDAALIPMSDGGNSTPSDYLMVAVGVAAIPQSGAVVA